MGIEVDVKASSDKSQTSAVAQGSIMEVVTDEDRRTLNLNESTLKKAVGVYYGKEPADVFVRSPTPWGDLYEKYNWQQVTKILEPISTKVLGVRTQPTIVATKDFTNDSSVETTINAGISQNVSNTVSSSWSKEHSINFEQKVKYKMDFLVAGAEGETTFSYGHTWGEEHSQQQQITLASSSSVEVTLKPGQAVTSTLTANRGTMEVEVTYRVRLEGIIATNYPDRYKDHYFWGLDVNPVLKADGLETTWISKEILKIGFYSDGQVVVTDKKTAIQMRSAPVDFIQV